MTYKARYYDPLIGRFTQPDTIIPDPADPQDLNRYTYVRNNPVRYADPTGHCPDAGCWELFGTVYSELAGALPDGSTTRRQAEYNERAAGALLDRGVARLSPADRAYVNDLQDAVMMSTWS